MPFRFTCPHCKHTTLIEDRYVDQSGECAVCGKAITIRCDPEETLAPRPTQARKLIGGGSVAVMAVLLTLAAMAALVAFVVAVMFMAVPATQMAQSNAAQTACAANLTRIGQAMLDYHVQYGRFPPAYIADDDGIPKHSWRVLLLPYLGENATYQSYNMKAAWSDWENTYSVGSMPSVYHCRDDLNDASRETSYLIVNGPGMIFNGTESASLGDITDGPENTILLVEVAGSTQYWLEPKDLDRRALKTALNTGTGQEIGSYHPAGGAHVLMADGSVRFLSDLTSPQAISAMLTIDAGDDAAAP